MAILRLLAHLGLDKSGFDAGLKSADQSVKKFGTDLKGQLAGAFTAAAVGGFVKSIVSMGSEIKDLQDRLGLSVEDIQTFSLAAKLGGTEVDVFAAAVEKLRKGMAGFSVKGGHNPLELFGISDQELLSGNVSAVLKDLAADIEENGINAQRTAALFDIFGKSAGRVVQMLQSLKDVKGASLLSQRETEDLDRFGDALTKLWNNIKVGGARLFTHPTAPLQGIVEHERSPQITDQQLDSIEAQRKWEEKQNEAAAHMAEQDRILADEESQRQAHMAEQDRLAAEARTKASAELLRGTTSPGGTGGLAGLFVGAQAAAGMPGDIKTVKETLIKMERAMVERGIVVRDKLN